MKKFLRLLGNPLILLVGLIFALYYQFFIFGKIPVPADTLVGAYFPWLDYKWGYAVGVPVKNALLSDSFSQFFLWKHLAVDFVKQGIVPLWNPYSYSGTPFLATYHSAVLLPFNLLLLFPKYFGWGLYIFGQTFLAAVGMYLLLGVYIKNSAAKLAGSLVFALSGLMTTWLELGTGVYAAAMLPWIFYSLISFFNRKNIFYLFLFTLSFICLYLAGHAQLTVYSTILFFIFLLFQLKKYRIRVFLPVLFFWVISLGVFSIQMLPTYELTKNSIRGTESYSSSFNYGLNPLYEVIRFTAPDFFGNPTTYNHWDKQSYHEQSSFLGAIALPLIIPLFFRRFRSKESQFWLWTLVVSLILAFDSPLTQWIYKQPIPLLTYSSASRIFFITSFAAGILVAFGLTKFAQDLEYRRFVRRTTRFILASFLGIFLGFLAIYLFLKPYLFDPQNIQVISNLKVSLKNSFIPVGILFGLLVLAYPIFKKKIFIYVLVLVLFLDLGRYFLKYNPFVDSLLVFPNTPIIDFLQKEPGLFRIARADYDIMTPNTWTHYKLQSIEGYDPLSLESYGRYFNLVNGKDYESGVGRYTELQNYPNQFIDALNVKYLLAIKRTEKDEIGGDFLNYKIRNSNYEKVFEDKSTAIVKNPDSLERAYFASEVITASSKQDLINKISDKKFNPKQQAVIEEKIDLPESLSIGQVNITKYSPIEKIVETEVEGPGFLILADSFENGWKAYKKNGKDEKLFRVNSALQGIKIRSGKNTYIFKYEPLSFKVGSTISISSLGLLLVLFVASLSGEVRKRIYENTFGNS